MTLLVDTEEPSKKDKKKKKKARLAEERAWLEARAAASAPALRPSTTRQTELVALQEWLHALGSDRVVAATKSSFMVAANGIMIAIAAHALYDEPALGPLVPLAVTSLLAMVLSVAAARAVKEGDFETPPRPLEQTPDELLAMLSHELYLRTDALAKSRARMRSAYSVLLGGLALSALTFVISAVLGG